LKLLGSIFEEVYGPLSHSDAVNGDVDPTCVVSQLPPVDAENSAKQANSSAQLCEPAALNVTHSSAVTRQCPAEVSESSVCGASVSASYTRSTVLSSSEPSMRSELTSAVSHQSSDIARDWSTGVLIADCSGRSVEVSTLSFHVGANVRYLCLCKHVLI